MSAISITKWQDRYLLGLPLSYVGLKSIQTLVWRLFKLLTRRQGLLTAELCRHGRHKIFLCRQALKQTLEILTETARQVELLSPALQPICSYIDKRRRNKTPDNFKNKVGNNHLQDKKRGKFGGEHIECQIHKGKRINSHRKSV